jgi:hypothetical protein
VPPYVTRRVNVPVAAAVPPTRTSQYREVTLAEGNVMKLDSGLEAHCAGELSLKPVAELHQDVPVRGCVAGQVDPTADTPAKRTVS